MELSDFCSLEEKLRQTQTSYKKSEVFIGLYRQSYDYKAMTLLCRVGP